MPLRPAHLDEQQRLGELGRAVVALLRTFGGFASLQAAVTQGDTGSHDTVACFTLKPAGL